MRVFFSAGEASGEMLAADLLRAMRARGADVEADAVGGPRLAAAGARIFQSNAGWAAYGPLDAARRIPLLIAIGWKVAAQMRFGHYDLIVMVDYGAFNLRVAGMTRSLGTQTPILYYFPPAAWLDDERRARKLTARCEPLTPFTHQRDFYRSLGLPIGWVGHPLVSTVAPRPARPPAPSEGGVIALLPGSRSGELARHTPRLLDALEVLRARRPAVRGVLAAIDDGAVNRFEHLLRLHPGLSVRIVHSAREALADADAAAVASGTAVLEAALMEVPTVGFYVLSELQARIARRVWHGRFILLPNLILDEPVVPELLQESATPRALADALDAALRAPDAQLADFRRLREALGPSDALERSADFAIALARVPLASSGAPR